MKVIVANTLAPFLRGGAEQLGDELVVRLRAAGHDVEPLRLPFRWQSFDEISTDMVVARSLRGLLADRVIALRFPAYLVQHPAKTVWLLHQFRYAYDLWSPDHAFLGENPAGRANRSAIMSADAVGLGEARQVVTNSVVTQRRLREFNGIPSTVVVPPLVDAELFSGGEYGSYIFAGGRINADKRQHLLVEAMRSVGEDVRLVVAGPPDSPADAERLRGIVREAGLTNVTLEFGFIPRKRYAAYMTGALACAYLPYDEDSYGYVAVEAAEAGKLVITASDSGGVLDLVRDGETGYVVEPSAPAVAAAIRRVAADLGRAQRMGRAAAAAWKALDVNWDSTIRRLLE